MLCAPLWTPPGSRCPAPRPLTALPFAVCASRSAFRPTAPRRPSRHVEAIEQLHQARGARRSRTTCAHPQNNTSHLFVAVRPVAAAAPRAFSIASLCQDPNGFTHVRPRLRPRHNLPWHPLPPHSPGICSPGHSSAHASTSACTSASGFCAMPARKPGNHHGQHALPPGRPRAPAPPPQSAARTASMRVQREEQRRAPRGHAAVVPRPARRSAGRHSSVACSSERARADLRRPASSSTPRRHAFSSATSASASLPPRARAAARRTAAFSASPCDRRAGARRRRAAHARRASTRTELLDQAPALALRGVPIFQHAKLVFALECVTTFEPPDCALREGARARQVELWRSSRSTCCTPSTPAEHPATGSRSPRASRARSAGSPRTSARRARNPCGTRARVCARVLADAHVCACAATNVPAAARGDGRGQDRPGQDALLPLDDRARGAQPHQGRAVLLLRRDRGAQDHLWQGAHAETHQAPCARDRRALAPRHRCAPRTRASCTASRTTCALRSSSRSSASNTSSSRPSTATSARSTTSRPMGCGDCARNRDGEGGGGGECFQVAEVTRVFLSYDSLHHAQPSEKSSRNASIAPRGALPSASGRAARLHPVVGRVALDERHEDAAARDAPEPPPGAAKAESRAGVRATGAKRSCKGVAPCRKPPISHGPERHETSTRSGRS